MELSCKGSWYSLSRLRNSIGTWERAGDKELDQAAVVLPTMTMDFLKNKSNVILHWTFIKDFLLSSLSCKTVIPCSHFDSVAFSSLLLLFPFCLLDECSFHWLIYGLNGLPFYCPGNSGKGPSFVVEDEGNSSASMKSNRSLGGRVVRLIIGKIEKKTQETDNGRTAGQYHASPECSSHSFLIL